MQSPLDPASIVEIPERLFLYLTSAMLVGCMMFGYVRASTWKVFFVYALIAVIVLGAIMGRLVGGDHPGFAVGLILLFMVIAGVGVILGFLWTLAAPIRIRISRRFRRAITSSRS